MMSDEGCESEEFGNSKIKCFCIYGMFISENAVSCYAEIGLQRIICDYSVSTRNKSSSLVSSGITFLTLYSANTNSASCSLTTNGMGGIN